MLSARFIVIDGHAFNVSQISAVHDDHESPGWCFIERPGQFAHIKVNRTMAAVVQLIETACLACSPVHTG